MEVWFIILISLCLTALLKPILDFLLSPKPSAIAKLPPGPTTIPMIGNLARLLPTLRNLHAKHGPIVALRIGLRPAIFVSDRFLAHQALVQNGAVFADRPPALGTAGVITSNQRNVSSASYGPTWRLLRRNLTAEILHPSRVKSYAPARRWVLELLASRLQQPQNGAVCAVEHFQYAMFCLLVFMCFGERLSEKEIREIETVQRDMLLGFGKFNILNLWPKLTKVVFRKRWEEFLQLRRNQESVLIPHIRARKEAKTERITKSDGGDDVLTYVDTLLGLTFPDENRNLNEGEMVTLCAEFLNGGTDTTSTALQWVMANLVKHPRIQSKLAEEIMGVTGEEEEVKEEDLQKLPYLKAVILESLRLHPPGHLLLPHAVTEDDVTLGGFLVPRNGTVNFMVAEIGRDPKVWEEPMEFKPERFLVYKELAGGFDLTGSKEIKMMPFGAGRRICPAHGLAMLHLEYFVANLVRRFSWEAVDGDEVDLTEKREFTVVMKHPLRARIFPR